MHGVVIEALVGRVTAALILLVLIIILLPVACLVRNVSALHLLSKVCAAELQTI